MKLSTKGRYGLRCMVDLALTSSGEHVALYSIAERQGLSVLYLEQVFSTLRKAGLVKSVKGAGGGYSLADAPSRITVGSVLRALEGNISIVNSLSKEDSEQLNNLERCIRTTLWTRIDDSISDIIDSVTLEDLAEESMKMDSKDHLMYYI